MSRTIVWEETEETSGVQIKELLYFGARLKHSSDKLLWNQR